MYKNEPALMLVAAARVFGRATELPGHGHSSLVAWPNLEHLTLDISEFTAWKISYYFKSFLWQDQLIMVRTFLIWICDLRGHCLDIVLYLKEKEHLLILWTSLINTFSCAKFLKI